MSEYKRIYTLQTWMDDHFYKVVLLIVVIIAISFVISNIIPLLSTPTASAGQVIHFNGQTLDLSDASNVLIQSSNDVRVFDADKQGGAVTVTTSIVTVTVWMKP